MTTVVDMSDEEFLTYAMIRNTTEPIFSVKQIKKLYKLAQETPPSNLDKHDFWPAYGDVVVRLVEAARARMAEIAAAKAAEESAARAAAEEAEKRLSDPGIP